jgi:FMN-dependent NADH-azoreductase
VLRNNGSISRKATEEFLTKWKAREPHAVIVERDLAAHPLPHPTGRDTGAFFTPAE